MSDSQAEPRRTRLSAVWLIPLAAALIGLWLVFSYLSSQGPVITLKLADAEGINAGKTAVKTRNVQVGLVESVSLSDDMSHTLLTVQMQADTDRMLAEDTRLIVPIGQWVMRKACEEARNWPQHVKVNVNVSPEQLLEPAFHDEVVQVLAATGLRPERLEIEVTESIFLRDASVARNALEQVMALGCSVALDDFGTGYSSLGYLRKLRFSTIKVDRTFVQGAAQGSAESLAIINAVVAMARSLKMTTTAEGVETAQEADLIRKLGCDKIQGFYFGRPMGAKEALALFNMQQERRA